MPSTEDLIALIAALRAENESLKARYTSIEFGKRCREAGVRPSMGSVGDATTIYGRLPPQGDLLGSAAWMHEFIRPVAGAIALRALMEVHSLWPYNAIGLGGLVVGQAFKQRSVPTSHQFTSHSVAGSRGLLFRRDHAATYSSFRASRTQAILAVLLASATSARLNPRLAANSLSHWERRSLCSPVGTLPRVRRGSSVAAGRVRRSRRAAIRSRTFRHSTLYRCPLGAC